MLHKPHHIGILVILIGAIFSIVYFSCRYGTASYDLHHIEYPDGWSQFEITITPLGYSPVSEVALAKQYTGIWGTVPVTWTNQVYKDLMEQIPDWFSDATGWSEAKTLEELDKIPEPDPITGVIPNHEITIQVSLGPFPAIPVTLKCFKQVIYGILP